MLQPHDLTTHDGKVVDWVTHCALLEAELLLKYRLTVIQGGNRPRSRFSATTHCGLGVVDLAAYDWQEKVRVLRGLGFAVWHRTAVKELWNEHCHAVLAGDTKADPAALRQVTSYFDGRDGLRGDRADPTWKPHPIPTYTWPGEAAALALEARVHALLDVPATPKQAPTPTGHALRVDGVDLSHWNPVTPAQLAVAARGGVRFAYLKATEGPTTTDPTFAGRELLARTAGLVVGAYHFGRPNRDGTDGAAEARRFLAVAKPTAGDMLPMLDLEDRGGLSRPALTRWVRDFVGVVHDQLGALPVIYTPFDLDDHAGCPLWVARYHPDNAAPHVPAPWKAWTIRQFSNGQVGRPSAAPGLGHVDLNTLHDGFDLADLRIPVRHTPKPVTPVVVSTPAKPAPTPGKVAAGKVAAFPRWDKTTPALTIFHGPEGDYARPNSLRGIDWAVRVGANAIDHDVHVTKDGHLVVTHWGQPLRHGFVDTSGRHAENSPVSIGEMTLEQVGQLRHRVGSYSINSLAVDAVHAAKAGVTLCLEQKGDTAFTQLSTWDRAYTEVRVAGAQAIVMSLPDMPHAATALLAAGQAGFRTMLLTRGHVPSAFYELAHLAAVKGPTARNRGLPKGVVRLGTSAVNATRYGCSVGPGGSKGATRVIRLKGGNPAGYRKA